MISAGEGARERHRGQMTGREHVSGEGMRIARKLKVKAGLAGWNRTTN